MVNDFQLVMNALARGLELERQNTGKDIGLEAPPILSSLHPPTAVRALLTISGCDYEVVMRRSGGKGVYPAN